VVGSKKSNGKRPRNIRFRKKSDSKMSDKPKLIFVIVFYMEEWLGESKMVIVGSSGFRPRKHNH